MSEQPSATTPEPPPQFAYAPPAPRPRLRRSKDDRVIGGVCGGVGRTLGIDPVILRIVLAVLTLFGGTGVLLYLVAWLFVPEDGTDVSAGESFAQRNGKALTIVLAVVAGCVLLPLTIGGLWFLGEWGPWGGPGFGPLIIIGAIAAIAWFAVRDRDRAAAPTPPVSYGAYGEPITTPPAVPPVPLMTPGTEAAPGMYASAQATPSAAYAQQAPPAAYPAQPPYPVAYSPTGAPGYVPPGYPPYGPPRPLLPPPPPPRPRESSVLGILTLSAAALTAGVLWVLDIADVIEPDWFVYPAAVLGVLGLGLLVGAFVGRARWLVALAIPVTVVTVVAGHVTTWGNGEVGERRWNPTTVEQAAGPWELGVGDARLDLTGVQGIDELTEDLVVVVEQGVGDMRIYVPRDVPLTVNAEAGAGELEVGGVTEGGFDISLDREFGDTSQPGIVLDLTIGLGHVEVFREAA